jgi:hypothetical protein
MDSDDDDGEVFYNEAAAHHVRIVQAMIAWEVSSDEEDAKTDHRTLPRRPRKSFEHDAALRCILRDYLGPIPIFNGRDFDVMFRISKSRFQKIMEDVGNSNILFYRNRTAGSGIVGASFQAKLLLPLKSLAYGVPSHTFRDYFQMSQTLARECCRMFDHAIKSIYAKEFLRLPTSQDLKNIVELHKEVHNIDGMFGSLDCIHTVWKNCPVAWQGSYMGAKHVPTIVLEALCDYNMFFWHVSYGYAGTLNDKTILDLSPFLESLVNGSFIELEKNVVPFLIGEEIFDKAFILCDGIYPPYSRFVKGIKEPIHDDEKKFTEWQESSRKDIERAFGVLQCKFQYLARPFRELDLKQIGDRVATCLLLHNMCVSDRIMGDVRVRYNPADGISSGNYIVDHPADLQQVQGAANESDRSTIGMDSLTPEATHCITRRGAWSSLTDAVEHSRLHSALKREIVNKGLI